MASDKITQTVQVTPNQEVEINPTASVAASSAKALRPELAEPVIIATTPTPPFLKYLLATVLAFSVLGVSVFAVIHQSSVKPPADTNDCSDPVAENRLRDAVRTNPNDYQNLIELGSYSYTCTKDYASAISAYSQAAVIADNAANKVDAESWMQVHMSLGLAYLSNRNPDLAAEQLQKILDKQPDNPNALLAMGAAKYALAPQSPQTAFDYWQKVIKQNPNSSTAQQAQMFIDAVNKSNPSNPAPTSSTVK